MKAWGIVFILLGGGILTAVFNWNAWFRISSAGGRITHDDFGRTFACLLNIAVAYRYWCSASPMSPASCRSRNS